MLYDTRWDKAVEAKPLEAWRVALLDGADYIEKHGWCRYVSVNEKREFCITGALMRVSSGRALTDAFARLGDFLGVSPPTYNDVHAEGMADVTAKMRACAVAE